VIGAGGDADPASPRERAAQWLASSLHPIALDHVVSLGRKLRARAIDPGRAALDWLEATDRAADRVGLVDLDELLAGSARQTTPQLKATCQVVARQPRLQARRRDPAAGRAFGVFDLGDDFERVGC